MTEIPLKNKMDASCRMAFAACLHDLGKFAERARIEEAATKDAQGNSIAERNKQLYCPNRDGRYSHVHAAYSAIAIDLLESALPPLKGADVGPFAAWNEPGADDSLINAAAMHHKPDTALQWLIATADRVASGFERDAFDDYNQAVDDEGERLNHYTRRQLTLFEQIRLDGAPVRGEDLAWRYRLEPLSVASLFPAPASEIEKAGNKAGQADYRKLWDAFRAALDNIPATHRKNWSLWLDHFDSLWAAYASAIPSATVGDTKPEVSLYDHSRATAALATALWRYHESDPPEEIREQLRAQWDRERQQQSLAESAWNEDKFLLVIGDFFGIQSFIFASGGETQKNAAKLLRGRSAYISLLTECAALRILDELGLPPTSQVINAAGKFLIVAPNRPEVREKLSEIQSEFNHWFLKHTWGESGIGIAWEPAACHDFLDHNSDDGEPPFKRLIDRLFQRLEDIKARRLALCADNAPAPVFEGFLDSFHNDKGVCAIDGRSPASESLPKAEDKFISPLALDQINTGKWLAHNDRLLVTRSNIDHHTLTLSLFGYHISFTGNEDASGKFGELAVKGDLRRAWDYSLPAAEDAALFNGYARRNINAYVPQMGDANAWEADRYKGIEEDADWDALAPKSFEHIARDDLWLDASDRWKGTEALITLKGDVDNLGRIFEAGLEKPSFAKWASLSRQMNAFFAVFLPWYCRTEYPSTYTVFAGGDDFFLIGPWRSTIRLARGMREAFHRYVAENADIHFSTGLLMTKPGLPVAQMGEMAEQALEHAKSHDGKNAVTLFGQTVSWDDFDELWKTLEAIKEKDDQFDLSTGYLYRLQDLADMSHDLKWGEKRPENAIWRSWFSYRTYRMLEQALKGKDRQKERERRMQELAKILSEPIERFGSRFKIPLFIHLYQQRS
ncbi:MAG TPA: type III-A CRISPR-associated protein Cas10/Csm1 [Gammaproteobacteria bacterium]|nr:type III-A CRISPR-associated protein Cas10/Csm1 [Gammaproteobacteria bacterium]